MDVVEGESFESSAEGSRMWRGLLVGYLGLVFFASVWFYGVYWRPLRHLPGPFPLPVLGNVLQLTNVNLQDYQMRMHGKYGDTFVCWYFWQPMVFLSQATDAVKVGKCPARGDVSRLFRLHESAGKLRPALFQISGAPWRKRRNYLAPCFSSARFEATTVTVCTNAHRLVANWRAIADSGEDRNVLPDLRNLSLDLVADTIFGADFGCVKGEPSRPAQAWNWLIAHAEAIEEDPLRLLKTRLPMLPSQRRYRKEHDIFHGFFDSVMASHYQDKAEGKPGLAASTVMGALVMSEGAEGEEGLEPELVRAELVQFMIATLDTISIHTSMALYYLAYNQEAQATLHAELDEVFGVGCELPINVALADLQRLPFTEAVVNEGLRLQPIVPIHLRDAFQDFTVGEKGLHVPQGTMVGASCYALQHDKMAWGPDADSFKPARWLDTAKIDELHRYYCPFGVGLKTCIGYKIALVELRVLIAVLMKEFKVLPPAEETPLDPYMLFVASPRRVHLRLERR